LRQAIYGNIRIKKPIETLFCLLVIGEDRRERDPKSSSIPLSAKRQGFVHPQAQIDPIRTAVPRPTVEEDVDRVLDELHLKPFS
jgi:hypothetical protein